MTLLVKDVVDNVELLEVGRKAVEDHLVMMRDSRLSIVGRNNGLVIKEADGSFDYPAIRLGTEEAIRIALIAMLEHKPSDFVVVASGKTLA